MVRPSLPHLAVGRRFLGDNLSDRHRIAGHFFSPTMVNRPTTSGSSLASSSVIPVTLGTV